LVRHRSPLLPRDADPRPGFFFCSGHWENFFGETVFNAFYQPTPSQVLVGPPECPQPTPPPAHLPRTRRVTFVAPRMDSPPARQETVLGTSQAEVLKPMLPLPRVSTILLFRDILWFLHCPQTTRSSVCPIPLLTRRPSDPHDTMWVRQTVYLPPRLALLLIVLLLNLKFSILFNDFPPIEDKYSFPPTPKPFRLWTPSTKATLIHGMQITRPVYT